MFISYVTRVLLIAIRIFEEFHTPIRHLLNLLFEFTGKILAFFGELPVACIEISGSHGCQELKIKVLSSSYDPLLINISGGPDANGIVFIVDDIFMFYQSLQVVKGQSIFYLWVFVHHLLSLFSSKHNNSFRTFFICERFVELLLFLRNLKAFIVVLSDDWDSVRLQELFVSQGVLVHTNIERVMHLIDSLQNFLLAVSEVIQTIYDIFLAFN